jgi:hypothetical protein
MALDDTAAMRSKDPLTARQMSFRIATDRGLPGADGRATA